MGGGEGGGGRRGAPWWLRGGWLAGRVVHRRAGDPWPWSLGLVRGRALSPRWIGALVGAAAAGCAGHWGEAALGSGARRRARKRAGRGRGRGRGWGGGGRSRAPAAAQWRDGAHRPSAGDRQRRAAGTRRGRSAPPGGARCAAAPQCWFTSHSPSLALHHPLPVTGRRPRMACPGTYGSSHQLEITADNQTTSFCYSVASGVLVNLSINGGNGPWGPGAVGSPRARGWFQSKPRPKERTLCRSAACAAVARTHLRFCAAWQAGPPWRRLRNGVGSATSYGKPIAGHSGLPPHLAAAGTQTYPDKHWNEHIYGDNGPAHLDSVLEVGRGTGARRRGRARRARVRARVRVGVALWDGWIGDGRAGRAAATGVEAGPGRRVALVVLQRPGQRAGHHHSYPMRSHPRPPGRASRARLCRESIPIPTPSSCYCNMR